MVLIRRLVEAELRHSTLSIIQAFESATDASFVPFLLVGPVSMEHERLRAEALRVVGLVLSSRSFRIHNKPSGSALGVLRKVARRAAAVTTSR